MYIYIYRESSGGIVIQSCPTLVTPWIVCSRPGSSVHGIFQVRILEWAAISFSRYTYLKRYIYIYIYIYTHTPEDTCSWRRECIWSPWGLKELDTTEHDIYISHCIIHSFANGHLVVSISWLTWGCMYLFLVSVSALITFRDGQFWGTFVTCTALLIFNCFSFLKVVWQPGGGRPFL